MASIYDNYISTLTPLQLTVTEGMLKNTALRVNPTLTSAVSSFTSLGLISSYLSMQTAALAGTGGCTSGQAATLGNIASPTCAALADGIPQYYLTLGTFSNVSYPPGITGIISKKAYLYIGSPTGVSTNIDLSRFAQIYAACNAYAQLANQIIISTCNSDDYLCDTFSNNDNLVTGDITKVNQATSAFGQDLAKLGQLIDLENLNDLGSPLALMQRIIALSGTIPTVALTFVATGVPQDVIINLDKPDVSVDDAAQKAMYQAMTQITGDALSQILQILGVTTAGITTMADLLNPVKLFPNSFQSLTVTTKNGLRGIYTNSSGSVNTSLVQMLPSYVINSSVANMPPNTPVTGTLPVGAGNTLIK